MQRIPVLNGLRGLAILAVIFHHSFFPYVVYNIGRPITTLAFLESCGWLGVNLFFFLSGFVLFIPYAGGERSFTSLSEVRAFYEHRAKRLLPLYYTRSLIFLIFTTSYQLNDPRLYKVIADMAFATFIFKKETFFPQLNWVLWSLGVEIWFSAVFPLLVLAIKRFGWSRTLVTVILIALSFRILGRIWSSTATRPTINFVSDSIGGRLDEFMLGMAGAQIYRFRMFARHAPTQFVLGGLLMASVAGLWAAWYRGHYPFAIAGLFNIPFDVGMLLLVNGLIVGCRPVALVVCAWPLQMSGLMCYSLYLWHGLIITHYRQSAYTVPTYFGYIAITYLIAWLSYRYIEFGATRDWTALLPARQPSLSATNAAEAR